MSAPMTADQQLTKFRAAGIKCVENPGWKTHNRNSKGPWDNVNGFIVHHTGSDSTNQVSMLSDGFPPELPGPLCQWGLAQDGTLHMIGNGRCNHAGKGGANVLDAVIAENYGAYPPKATNPGVDGNSRFYGVEIWYSGSHGMTQAQYNTLLKLAATVCKHHGWTQRSVIGHGEWSLEGKWDPGYSAGKMMDMNAVRNDVLATIQGKGDGVPETPSPESPKVISVQTGDTVVFPGGAKVVVQ